jgi:Methyltransferase domain
MKPADASNRLETPGNSPTAPCRVCGQSAQFFFSKSISGRHEVKYFKCPACGQVQTEEPYWLEETYRNADFQRDVGMADRCLWTAQTMVALAHRLGLGPAEPCLDWGAGTGLFVRLCRDYGLNFLYTDPYAQNVFARGFEWKAQGPQPAWACVTAFEVAEHFPHPPANFDGLFRLAPRFLLFSTLLYLDQGPDWWYFGGDGQHVAFYTRRSLEFIGSRHGYHLASNNCDLHLFSRERIPDRILDSARKSRVKLADRYRKKHGSRILSDFEHVTRLLDNPATPPA